MQQPKGKFNQDSWINKIPVCEETEEETKEVQESFFMLPSTLVLC